MDIELSNAMQLFSLEIERSVVGSLIIDPATYDDISSLITWQDFYDRKNVVIFKAIQRLITEGSSCDIKTLMERLRGTGELDSCGGIGYVAGTTTDIADASHIVQHARELRYLSIRRLMTRTCEEGIRETKNRYEEPAIIADKIITKLMRYSVDGATTNFLDLEDVYSKYLEDRKVIQDRRLNGDTSPIGLSTGYPSLDNILSGLMRGDMIIIGARPSVGKTALSVNIAMNAAYKLKKKVLFFSAEMNANKLGERILSIASNVDIWKMTNDEMTEKEQERFNKAVKLAKRSQLYIDDTSNINVNDIRARARKKHHELKGIDLVVVDYLQFITPDPSIQNREQQVSNISRGLKKLARELNVPIIVCSQLNRQITNREDPRPKLSDIRESGAIEQDSDVVLLLHREEYMTMSGTFFMKHVTKTAQAKYKAQYLIDTGRVYSEFDTTVKPRIKIEDINFYFQDIIIAKHRNGQTGTVRLWYARNQTRYIEYEEEAAPVIPKKVVERAKFNIEPDQEPLEVSPL